MLFNLFKEARNRRRRNLSFASFASTVATQSNPFMVGWGRFEEWITSGLFKFPILILYRRIRILYMYIVCNVEFFSIKSYLKTWFPCLLHRQRMGRVQTWMLQNHAGIRLLIVPRIKYGKQVLDYSAIRNKGAGLYSPWYACIVN